MKQHIQEQLENAPVKIAAVFAPGRLGERKNQITEIIKSGDAGLFEGGVQWRVLLPDTDKSLTGEAESLSAAFRDMAHCLGFLSGEHGDDTEVQCAIDVLPEEQELSAQDAPP